LLVVGLSFVNFLALPGAATVPHEGHARALNALLTPEPVALNLNVVSPGHAPDAVLDFPASSAEGFAGLSPRPSAEWWAEADPIAKAAALRGGAAANVPPAAAVAARSQESDAHAKQLHEEMIKLPASVRGKVTREAVATAGGVAMLDGESWFTLRKPIDADEITLGAWIYLPKMSENNFPASSSSMKTIVATKVSGCKVEGTPTEGWALFVHEWGTTNRQLRLSWTDAASACHEIYSKTSLVPYDTWVDVGFSLSKSGNRARLLLNDEVIADTQRSVGTYMKQGQVLPVTQAPVGTRSVARSSSTGLAIGAHSPQPSDAGNSQSHMFIGFIGDVKLIQEALDDEVDTLRLIRSPFNDLPSALTSKAAAHLTFQKGSGPKNMPDGAVLEIHHASGAVPSGKDGSSIVFEWKEKLEHPILVASRMDDISSGEPSPPGPTLDPAALKATWPAEWTKRWSEEELLRSQREADPWADEVREAMRHTWRGYQKKAWGRDDLKPDSGQAKDWCRMAVTMVDGLSTLWLMGLKDEFNGALKWIEEQKIPTPGKHGRHSLFEISIRALGGLLSAHSLSEKQGFLDAARRLADNLLPAFNTPSGIPKSTVDVGTGESQWHSWVSHAVLAEVATVQMEMRYLSHATGEGKYAQASDRAMQAVLDAAGGRGLVPIYMSRDDKTPKFVGSKISLGAMGDSYYEYLIKQWVQAGKQKSDDHLKDAWRTAMREMKEKLVFKTQGGRTFVAESDNNRPRMRMDHLACFVAGMLMMGSRTLPPEEVDPGWEPLAAEITETCYQMYKRSPSGLSAEYYVFNMNGPSPGDMQIPNDAPHNLLRPEAAEAIYYMHYYTGDPKYRRMAYEMFSGFQRHCKAKYGYSAVGDVRGKPPRHKDSQESFWLAETLKYFYLIFAPRDTLNLEEWVLNTEAQPMRIWH